MSDVGHMAQSSSIEDRRHEDDDEGDGTVAVAVAVAVADVNPIWNGGGGGRQADETEESHHAFPPNNEPDNDEADKGREEERGEENGEQQQHEDRDENEEEYVDDSNGDMERGEDDEDRDGNKIHHHRHPHQHQAAAASAAAPQWSGDDVALDSSMDDGEGVIQASSDSMIRNSDDVNVAQGIPPTAAKEADTTAIGSTSAMYHQRRVKRKCALEAEVKIREQLTEMMALSPSLSFLSNLYHVLWSNILCFLDEVSLYNVELAFPKKTRKISLWQWKFLRQRDMGRIQHQRWRPPDARFLRQQQQARFLLGSHNNHTEHTTRELLAPAAPVAAAASTSASASPSVVAATSSAKDAPDAQVAGAAEAAAASTSVTNNSGTDHHHHRRHRGRGRLSRVGRAQLDRTEWSGGTEEYLQSKSVMYGKDFARHSLNLDRLVPHWDVYDERDVQLEDDAELDQETFLLSRGGIGCSNEGIATSTTTTTATATTDLVRRYLLTNMLRRNSHPMERRHLAAAAHSRFKTRIPMGIGVNELGSSNYLLFVRLSLLPPKQKRQLRQVEQQIEQQQQQQQQQHLQEKQPAQQKEEQPDDCAASQATTFDDGDAGIGDSPNNTNAGTTKAGTNAVPDTTPSSTVRKKKRKAGCLDFLPFAIPFSPGENSDCEEDVNTDNVAGNIAATPANTRLTISTSEGRSTLSSTKRNDDAIGIKRKNIETTRHWHAFRQIYQIVVHPSRKMALSLSSTFGQFQGLADDWPEIKEFLDWHELEWTIISTLHQSRRLGQEAESLYRYEEACQAKLIPLLERLELAITIPTCGHLIEHHRRRQVALEQASARSTADVGVAANVAPDAAGVDDPPAGPMQQQQEQEQAAVAAGSNGTVNDVAAASVVLGATSNVPTAQQLHEQQKRLHESFVAVGRCSSLKWTRMYKTDVRTAIPESRNVLTLPGQLELRAALFRAGNNNNITNNNRPQPNEQEPPQQQQQQQQQPPRPPAQQHQPPPLQHQAQRSLRFDERQLRFLPDVIFEEAPSINDDLAPRRHASLPAPEIPVQVRGTPRRPLIMVRPVAAPAEAVAAAVAAAAQARDDDHNIGAEDDDGDDDDDDDDDAFSSINDDDSVPSLATALTPSRPDPPIMPWEVIIPITNTLEASFLVYRQQPQPQPQQSPRGRQQLRACDSSRIGREI